MSAFEWGNCVLGEVRKNLRWADAKDVKSEIDVQLRDLLGAKTAADLEKPSKTKV